CALASERQGTFASRLVLLCRRGLEGAVQAFVLAAGGPVREPVSTGSRQHPPSPRRPERRVGYLVRKPEWRRTLKRPERWRDFEEGRSPFVDRRGARDEAGRS